MSAVDPHVEAHRLKAELGWGERRIAQHLGISRYRAGELLRQPLPQPVADKVAELVGQADARAADTADQEPEPVRLGVDLSRRPWLWRDVAYLLRLGLKVPSVVDVAVRAFVGAYRAAVERGELRPGEPYQVACRVRRVPAPADQAA